MRRRILASVGGKPLPYDAEVEYLEANGTQYIDTGVVMRYESSVEIVADFISGHIFGRADDTATNRVAFLIALATNGRLICDFGYYDRRVNGPYYSGGLVTIRANCPYLTVDGYDYTTRNQVFESSDVSAFLFARSGSSLNAIVGKIFSCKIDDGMTRDFFPVRFTNENGVSEGAMYDRAGSGGMNPDGTPRTDGLYRNRGTGSFGWKELDGTIVPPQ